MKNPIRILLWLLYLAGSLYVLAFDTALTSDLTFFLPRSTDPYSNAILQLTRKGPGSRLMLAEIQGADLKSRLRVAHQLVTALNTEPQIQSVRDGIQATDLQVLEQRLFPYRFHLRDPSQPTPWEAQSLHAAFLERISELTGPAGRLYERWLSHDPVGEWSHFLKRLEQQPAPESFQGHWIRGTEKNVLLLIETKAQGFDLAAQSLAQDTVLAHFNQFAVKGMSLKLGGASVLAVEANRRISKEAGWLSMANTLMVSVLLLAVYRSMRIYVLGLLPLLTGLISGAIAIRWAFGDIHAITLGFGSTLLGVAADYPNHFFTHIERHQKPQITMERLWPTLRLGLITNIAGFGVMVLSGFRGLQEIGIFAAAGLLGAGLTTRLILPLLAPSEAQLSPWLTQKSSLLCFSLSRKARVLICLLVTAWAGTAFLQSGKPLFNDDLASLNPVPSERLAEDIALQQAFHIPDMRHLLWVVGESGEETLQQCERVGPELEALRQHGALEGYQLLCHLLPSQKTQNDNLSMLPTQNQARTLLARAIKDTPFRLSGFEPFFDDLIVVRDLPPLNASLYQGTLLETEINALHLASGDHRAIMIPLYGIQNLPMLETELRPLEAFGIHLIDLRSTLTDRIRLNRLEASKLILLGILGIYGFLVLGLRSFTDALTILSPMLLATLCTAWIMATQFGGLTVYHLASLLLVMGLSLDQTLFFNRPSLDTLEQDRTRLAIVVCSLSSMFAFGGLALSSVELLSAIGSTVATGAFLAIGFTAVLAKHPSLSR